MNNAPPNISMVNLMVNHSSAMGPPQTSDPSMGIVSSKGLVVQTYSIRYLIKRKDILEH